MVVLVCLGIVLVFLAFYLIVDLHFKVKGIVKCIQELDELREELQKSKDTIIDDNFKTIRKQLDAAADCIFVLQTKLDSLTK